MQDLCFLSLIDHPRSDTLLLLFDATLLLSLHNDGHCNHLSTTLSIARMLSVLSNDHVGFITLDKDIQSTTYQHNTNKDRNIVAAIGDGVNNSLTF